MHCENCGGNLSLEELVCPHCGTINKQAQQHVQDMNRYANEFTNTQRNVYKVTGNYASITVRAVIITVLVIMIAVFGFVAYSSYDIKNSMAEHRAIRNQKEYIAIMEEYLANEDYLAMDAFCRAKSIYGYEEAYRPYFQIIRVCNQYAYLYEQIFEARSRLLKTHFDEKLKEGEVERLVDYIEYFYEAADMEKEHYYADVLIADNEAIVEGVEDKVALLLQTYCNLTPKEVEMLPTMSGGQRRVLLEERMLNAE